jgi:hypothetical protein
MGMQAFMITKEMHGWCQNKQCDNYKEKKPEGIPWFKLPPYPTGEIK